MEMLVAAESTANGECVRVQSFGQISEEELEVLPRHIKVLVTGNNRTKSVLVDLHGSSRRLSGSVADISWI